MKKSLIFNFSELVILVVDIKNMSCSLEVQNHFVMMLKKYVGRRFWISKCRARVDKRNKDKVKVFIRFIVTEKNESRQKYNSFLKNLLSSIELHEKL